MPFNRKQLLKQLELLPELDSDKVSSLVSHLDSIEDLDDTPESLEKMVLGYLKLLGESNQLETEDIASLISAIADIKRMRLNPLQSKLIESQIALINARTEKLNREAGKGKRRKLSNPYIPEKKNE